MASVVALLRGINVGGRNRLAMAGLRDLLGDLGFGNPRTLLQSGNVVVDSEDPAEAVARAIAEGVAERFGVRADVMVRTGEEFRAVVDANPLADVADDPRRSMVAFLSAEPDPAVVDALAAQDFGREAFAARGRELYMWCPDGLSRSAVAAACAERRIGVRATVRNWSTVQRIAAVL